MGNFQLNDGIYLVTYYPSKNIAKGANACREPSEAELGRSGSEYPPSAIGAKCCTWHERSEMLHLFTREAELYIISLNNLFPNKMDVVFWRQHNGRRYIRTVLIDWAPCVM